MPTTTVAMPVLAVLPGHTALLVYRTFLFVTAQVSKVADDAGAGRKRTVV